MKSQGSKTNCKDRGLLEEIFSASIQACKYLLSCLQSVLEIKAIVHKKTDI